MKDNQRIFLDTNLMIYAHTNVDVLKQSKIQNMIINENTVISTQVLQEAANVLFKKFKFPWHDIQSVLKEMEQNNELRTNTRITIQRACDIAKQYQFSFYDSLIVAAALAWMSST